MSSGAGTKSVVVFGESGVGKTCFIDMWISGEHFVLYDPTGPGESHKTFTVDGERVKVEYCDLNASLFREQDATLHVSAFTNWISAAQGVILLYDITSKSSFDYLINEGYSTIMLNRKRETWNGVPLPCHARRFGCVLVGNKADLAPQKRAVDRDLAQAWADSQGIKFFEVHTFDPRFLAEPMHAIVRSIDRAEKRDAQDIEKAVRREQNITGKLPRRFSSFGSTMRHVFRKSPA